MHIGRNVWISRLAYNAAVNNCNTPSIFPRNILVAVFPEEELLRSTVPGSISNKNIKDTERQKPKTKMLDPRKTDACSG